MPVTGTVPVREFIDSDHLTRGTALPPPPAATEPTSLASILMRRAVPCAATVLHPNSRCRPAVRLEALHADTPRLRCAGDPRKSSVINRVRGVHWIKTKTSTVDFKIFQKRPALLIGEVSRFALNFNHNVQRCG
jgi:hypothetical protein